MVAATAEPRAAATVLLAAAGAEMYPQKAELVQCPCLFTASGVTPPLYAAVAPPLRRLWREYLVVGKPRTSNISDRALVSLGMVTTVVLPELFLYVRSGWLSPVVGDARRSASCAATGSAAWPASRGRGSTLEVPAACCVLDHFTQMMSPGAALMTSPLHVCLLLSNSAAEGGARFDCLSMPKNPKVSAVLMAGPIGPKAWHR